MPDSDSGGAGVLLEAATEVNPTREPFSRSLPGPIERPVRTDDRRRKNRDGAVHKLPSRVSLDAIESDCRVFAVTSNCIAWLALTRMNSDCRSGVESSVGNIWNEVSLNFKAGSPRNEDLRRARYGRSACVSWTSMGLGS